MKNLLALFAVLFLASCSKEPSIDANQHLDGNQIFDPSINNPEKYLVSYQNPDSVGLDKHIILAIHGYTATTFEWKEFADWTNDTFGSNGSYKISQVLMGAHGTDYNDFKNSDRYVWMESVKEEYNRLVAQGYTKISLVGSSTGVTVIIDLIHSGFFENTVKPKNLFLVDGIIVSSIKTQSIANIVGPMLVYVESTSQPAEQDSFWYRFRPQETVQELNMLMKDARKELEKGITAPAGTYVKVYHSVNDPTASSTSAVLIYKGLKHSDGSNIAVEMVDSDLHVFTRLGLREFEGLTVTQKDKDNQMNCFQDMASRLN